MSKSILDTNKSLKRKGKLQAENGYHSFVFQDDGNLVLHSLGTPIWASNTAGTDAKKLVMQSDGNLVLYSSSSIPLWASNTAGNGSSFLGMQDDRNLVLYRHSDRKPIWSTNTHTPLDIWEKHEFEAPSKLIAAAQADEGLAPYLAVGIACEIPGPHIWYCVGAAVVIATLIEFQSDEPFGPNNDIRVIGGQISQGAKDAGKKLSNWTKATGGKASDWTKDAGGKASDWVKKVF